MEKKNGTKDTKASEKSPPQTPTDGNAEDLSPIKLFDVGSAKSSTGKPIIDEFTRQSLLILVIQTMLTMIAKDRGGDEKTASKIFSHIYQQLVEMEVIPAYSKIEDEALSMKTLREKFHFQLMSLIASHKTHPTSHFDTEDYLQTFLNNDESIRLVDSYHPAVDLLPLKDYLTLSRFMLDFQNIQPLGSGGFGTVFKAQNILDKMYYAVKKIYSKMLVEGIEVVHREVKLLASLRHPNVVTYYSSWIEHQFVKHPKASSEVGESIPNTASAVETCLDSSQMIEGNGDELFLCMFIKMELCHINLETFLCDRNRSKKGGDCMVDFEQSKNFFSQILEGVSYIHSKKIIHRDLKPPNIFLNEKKTVVKIGDFGLARSMKSRSSSPTSEDQPLDDEALKVAQLTERIGTYTYSAPEQQNSSNYDQKADMFSLGIICFELFHSYRLGRERGEVLYHLRSKFGDIPEMQELVKHYPLIGQVVLSLLNEDPAKRPSAEEVLLKFASKSQEEINKDLANELMKKKKYVQKLLSENSELQHNVIQLQRINEKLKSKITKKRYS